jgi:hypothetical protein
MNLKNVQRYTSTYIEELLNKMKNLLTDQSDIDFIKDMLKENNSFSEIQNGRREKDKHPILNFNSYELLVDFRKFMEKYEGLLEENDYAEYKRNSSIINRFHTKFNKQLYYISVSPKNGSSPREHQSEKNIIQQLRNADAHGDIEIILGEWISGSATLNFYDKYKKVSIGEQQFKTLLSTLYSRAYNNSDIKDIYLLNKEETDELSPQITNEEELDNFLNKRAMLTVNIKGTKENSKDRRMHEKKITEMFFCTDDRTTYTDKRIDSIIKIAGLDKTEITEITEEDKRDIIEFTRKHPKFFKERVDIQRNLISEVLRKKYISKDEYELSKITKRLSDNNRIQYFEGKNIEYFEESIEKQFTILTKIVFLTNKEKIFDENVDYTKIDISKVDIKHIEQKNEKEFFRRLRNSFTHYRYKILGNEHDGLNRKIHLWDEDKDKITFDAEVDLKDCIKILLEMDFLREIDNKYKEYDDEILEFSEEIQEKFDCEDIAKNPKEFEYLDIEKRNNKSIVKSAITKERSILLHIGADIENDREFLKEILIEYPDAIIYLNKYKGDDEFVKIALSADGRLIDCVDDKYKRKEEYVLLSLESSGSSMILYDIPKDILYKKEFIKKAILINPSSIAITSPENKDDEELAMLAVKGDGMVISDISHRLQGDRKIAIEAIKNNICAKYYVSEKLYDDPEFCAEVEKIEKEYNSKIIEADEIEELSEKVDINEKMYAERFIDSIEGKEREDQKSE